MGLSDSFIAHGERPDLLAEVGLTPEAIVKRASSLVGAGLKPSLRETA
jgi:hypothetical protein